MISANPTPRGVSTGSAGRGTDAPQFTAAFAAARHLLLLAGTAAPFTARYRCFDCGSVHTVRKGLRLPDCGACDRRVTNWEVIADSV